MYNGVTQKAEVRSGCRRLPGGDGGVKWRWDGSGKAGLESPTSSNSYIYT